LTLLLPQEASHVDSSTSLVLLFFNKRSLLSAPWHFAHFGLSWFSSLLGGSNRLVNDVTPIEPDWSKVAAFFPLDDDNGAEGPMDLASDTGDDCGRWITHKWLQWETIDGRAVPSFQGVTGPDSLAIMFPPQPRLVEPGMSVWMRVRLKYLVDWNDQRFVSLATDNNSQDTWFMISTKHVFIRIMVVLVFCGATPITFGSDRATPTIFLFDQTTASPFHQTTTAATTTP
jgi:hypothetical protein